MHHWLDHHIPGAQRFGRRTLILLHAGFIWILTGWATLTIPTTRFSSPDGGGTLAALDSPLWGWMWIIGGLLAVIDAPLRKRRHGRDVAGFMGIVAPPVVWFFAFLWSSLAYVIPGGQAGNSRSPFGLGAWYLISVFVLIVAGWPDPDDPAITPEPRTDGPPE